MATYQNLITQSMYDKQLDSGKGTLLHLYDDVIQQEVGLHFCTNMLGSWLAIWRVNPGRVWLAMQFWGDGYCSKVREAWYCYKSEFLQLFLVLLHCQIIGKVSYKLVILKPMITLVMHCWKVYFMVCWHEHASACPQVQPYKLSWRLNYASYLIHLAIFGVFGVTLQHLVYSFFVVTTK